MKGETHTEEGEVVCKDCGKSFPSLNSLLHRLRCRGMAEKKAKEEVEGPHADSPLHNEEDRSEKDDTYENEYSADEQWSCRHCTFINVYPPNRVSDEPLICEMCQYSQTSDVNTWGSDSDSDYDSDDNNLYLNNGEIDEITEERSFTAIDPLSSWTCSYCTVVNTANDAKCSVCEMARVPTEEEPAVYSPTQHRLATRSLLESSVLTMGYFGLAVGAILTSGGSASRARNSLIGSVIGSAAGVAIAMYNVSSSAPRQEESDTSIAGRLPVHHYDSTGKNYDEQNSNKVSCRICMEEYETGELVKSLKCFHMFHADCLDKWLLRKQCCPLCNTAV